jgi:alkylhydroperoxidase family enzyme
MGHSEMLLAVAGLDKNTLNERTKKLASTDWSSFPPAERAGFFFAKKLAREPGSVSDQDVEQLIRHFGVPRTLDVIWWACRCNYMTRVADAFQIPLERDNVFEDVYPPGSPARPSGR